MLESVGNIFKIPDLKRKIFFTALILVIYRLGGFVPTPGVNAKVVSSFFNSAGASGNLFGLANLFSGGNLGRLSIFALGIMPYITTSIVIQLLGSIIPFFERLKKEGAEGQKKINQYTRYGTVAVAAFQAIGISFWTQSITAPLTVNGVQKVVSAVTHPGLLFVFTSVITLTTGVIFIMWLGEQITEHGIGNGISLIILGSILGPFFKSLSLLFSILIFLSESGHRKNHPRSRNTRSCHCPQTLGTSLRPRGK